MGNLAEISSTEEMGTETSEGDGLHIEGLEEVTREVQRQGFLSRSYQEGNQGHCSNFERRRGPIQD